MWPGRQFFSCLECGFKTPNLSVSCGFLITGVIFQGAIDISKQIIPIQAGNNSNEFPGG